ncbi:MAG: ATP-binding protein [Coprococcus sp.]
MYINKLLLKEFGKFNNKEIKLNPGLNLIYGPNESGKTTIKEFIVGMLYGIDKSRGLGAKLDNYQLRKPVNGSGYSGKAYVSYKGKSHLIERSFLRTNKNATLTEIETGKEVQLKKPNSFKGILFNVDKSTYVNTLCIGEHGAAPGKELADELGNYVLNLTTTKNADIDKAETIKYLKNEKKQYDNRKQLAQIESYEADMAALGDVDAELEEIREDRKEELDAYNMEIARLKREARQLVNEADAAIPDEDEDRERSRIFLEVEALEDEEPQRTKKEKKLSDNIFVILLTGIAVVVFVTLLVHLLNFQKSIQQLFTICSIAFVAITMIDGMYRKGFFDSADKVPDEDEFNKMVYELGRATESRTVRIEIDKNFQDAHDAKMELLKFKEHDAIARRDKYYELKSKRDTLREEYEVLEKEKRAIDLAIDTINDLSVDIYNDFGSHLNDSISEMVSIITDGKYKKVMLDDTMHISVLDGDHYMGIEYLSSGTMEQIYLAVRLCIASLLCEDKMPVIVDDIFTSYDSKRLRNTLYCMSRINTDQIIILTSNEAIGDMLDDLSMDYNYIEL